MDQPIPTQPNSTPANVPSVEPKGSIGSLIGSIIIIIVLVIGAIYFWGDMLNRNVSNKNQTASSTINIIENSGASTTSNGVPNGFLPEGHAAN